MSRPSCPAARLLEEARRAGLTFELDAAGELWFEADRAPPPELIAALRRYKTAIRVLLVEEGPPREPETRA